MGLEHKTEYLFSCKLYLISSEDLFNTSTKKSLSLTIFFISSSEKSKPISSSILFISSAKVRRELLLFIYADSTNFLFIVFVVLLDILSAYITAAVLVIDLISIYFFIIPQPLKVKTAIVYFLVSFI